MSSLSPLTDEECARCRLEGVVLENGFLLEDGGELRWLQPPQAHVAPAMKVVVGFASVVLVLGGVLPFSEGWLFEASPGGAGLSAQWWACGLGLLAWWSLGTLLIRRMWRRREHTIRLRADATGVVVEYRYPGAFSRVERHGWTQVHSLSASSEEPYHFLALILHQRGWLGPRRLLLYTGVSDSHMHWLKRRLERLHSLGSAP